jgi:hypothetical protein
MHIFTQRNMLEYAYVHSTKIRYICQKLKWKTMSATTLDVPGTYTSLLVYSKMNARWCCWRPEVGGETLLRAKIKGL